MSETTENETGSAEDVAVIFDLGSVPAADVGRLTMLHPQTRKPTTWILDLAGPAHPETIAITNESARERTVQEREQSREMAMALMRGGRKAKLPAIEVDVEGERDRTHRRVARRILGW